MWKFLKNLGRHSNSSANSSRTGSMVDLQGKYSLKKHCTHGYPLGPSCMAFDEYRRVLFIGTASGELKMVGCPGVELTACHEDINKVIQILPFATKPAIITLCANNLLHKWNLTDSHGRPQLELSKTYKFQGGLAKTITVCCLSPTGECIFVGTLGGITYPMDAELDGMSPEVLSWSRARANLGYKGKDMPGEVAVLEINPSNNKELLIGYEHNYLELWDAVSWKPLKILGPFLEEVGDLKSACWHSDGLQFVTGHADGSTCVWSVDNAARPTQVKKFYEERCQEIKRIFWPRDSLFVMMGGAPLDKMDGDSITVADSLEAIILHVTSTVKGMHILEDVQTDMDSGIVNAGSEGDSPTTVRKVLILMLEQEILFIDLRMPDLPLLLPPYLNSMHNSPVKLVDVYTDVTKEIWQTVCQLGKIQQDVLYRASSKVWPIDGGSLMFPAKENHTLLLSGHENGSVKFWDITDVSTKLIYSLECAHFFKTADSELGQSEDQQASQFRQVGFWDPRYDDDQLVVTALSLLEDELLVGFHGGIVLHLRLSTQSAHFTIPVVRASILREDPRQLGRNFQNPLEVRADEIESPPGFHPVLCVHLFPAASITAVALAKEQQLIGVGCIYGFTIIDHLLRTPLITTSTYDEVQNEIALTRMQSIRRSFRHSLKRLNVSRSMRNSQSTQRSMRSSSFVRAGSIRVSNRVTAKAPLAAAEPLPPPQPEPTPASAEVTPVALRRDSIRTISFMAPCHLGGNTPMPCVIVGTNQGSALAYTIDMPLAKHRDSRNPILMSIEEELNAKKNHAVLFIGVFDGQNYLLDINDKGSYHPGKGNEYLVVCTEDAIKTVSLPGGKKKNRIKLKANDEDEYHILSAHYLRSTGQSAMLLMDSSGNISVYNLPDLRLVYKESCVDSADAIGQRHFVCGTNGVLLHQRSPSEFMRGSVTEESRLEMQFSWSDNVTALRPKQPVIPNTPKSLFERKLEDPSELTTILSDSSSEPRGPTSPISEVGSPRAFQERAL
ncbi:hypothetical protein EMCRGX_G027621 [Ephydatia muelleri]